MVEPAADGACLARDERGCQLGSDAGKAADRDQSQADFGSAVMPSLLRRYVVELKLAPVAIPSSRRRPGPIQRRDGFTRETPVRGQRWVPAFAGMTKW